jgi:Protein of unknown function (DUF3071)
MTEQELTLVGLTEDNLRLVLVSTAGDEFTLPVDAKLRSTLRGGATGTGQLEIKMESTLRPRDIQARIRAGESPESVAAAAQTTLDRIMGYATPVLAERAHVADRAQRASVRRRSSEGPSRMLGDAVAEQLRSRNVDPHSVQWDAWRREDGRWTFVADYRPRSGGPDGSGHAEFVFDAPGRYVVPEDDEARWLVGERAAVTQESGAGPADPRRRLSPVGADEQLPLGEDAIGLVSESDPTSSGAEETTLDLSAAARAVREREARPAAPAPEPTAATADADWISTQATERPARVQTPSDEVPESAAEPEAEAEPAEEPAPQSEQPPRRAVKKNKGRASVPSWDEIMFGGGRSE